MDIEGSVRDYLTILFCFFFFFIQNVNPSLVIMHVFCVLCGRKDTSTIQQNPYYCSHKSTSSPLGFPSYTPISPQLLLTNHFS